jgi:hypothetical protein
MYISHSLEECIAQNDVVQPLQTWFLLYVPVDEEEHWQVDFLASSDLLLFEAEALYFCKVRCDL